VFEMKNQSVYQGNADALAALILSTPDPMLKQILIMVILEAPAKKALVRLSKKEMKLAGLLTEKVLESNK
jgi:hypothetical protein